jgi:hypothetical protein
MLRTDQGPSGRYNDHVEILPAPHPPAIYDRRQHRYTATEEVGYPDSIALADEALGVLHDHGKANGETPRTEAHRRDCLGWQATELPRDDGGEYHQHRHEQSESDEEIPIGAVEAVDVEVYGLHGVQQSIHAPLRVGLAETPRMPRCE